MSASVGSNYEIEESFTLDACFNLDRSGRQNADRLGFALNWKPWNTSCNWFLICMMVINPFWFKRRKGRGANCWFSRSPPSWIRGGEGTSELSASLRQESWCASALAGFRCLATSAWCLCDHARPWRSSRLCSSWRWRPKHRTRCLIWQPLF